MHASFWMRARCCSKTSQRSRASCARRWRARRPTRKEPHVFLKKLDVHGFKSFVDRTEVAFSSGITAIVGPNGCGKTNISDAIRWVMGEQSAKQLRGDAMDDVIFNGSARRKPIGLAEVTLTMLNDKGILPTEYTEVEIGRRVYRSGVSEYVPNKQVV